MLKWHTFFLCVLEALLKQGLQSHGRPLICCKNGTSFECRLKDKHTEQKQHECKWLVNNRMKTVFQMVGIIDRNKRIVCIMEVPRTVLNQYIKGFIVHLFLVFGVIVATTVVLNIWFLWSCEDNSWINQSQPKFLDLVLTNQQQGNSHYE